MGIFNPFRKKQAETSEGTTESTTAEDTAAPAAEAPAEEEAQPQGWFARIKQGMVKTKQLLNTDVRDLFKKERLIDEDFLNELFAILVRTDMGVGPATAIRDEVREKNRARRMEMEDVLQIVREKLCELMAQDEVPLRFADTGPTIVLVVGVNGSGKTTSIAKLTHTLLADGKKVVLGAGDTFRAAAVEQLTIWAERTGADIIKGEQGCDPASVAYRAVEHSVTTGADVCILDTAGRLQTQTNLMNELSKIKRVIQKQIPDAPHEVLLVLDATAGQNGISQAKGFSDAAECTGIFLSKLDGTAKGGVVIPIRQQFEIPVKFIGLGETPEAVAPFNANEFVNALFAEE